MLAGTWRFLEAEMREARPPAASARPGARPSKGLWKVRGDFTALGRFGRVYAPPNPMRTSTSGGGARRSGKTGDSGLGKFLE